MVCHIAPQVGTSGGTTACLSPSPPSRTGWRRRGKKGEARIDADYLDWALDGFSGYIAADELYNGPYCVQTLRTLFSPNLEKALTFLDDKLLPATSNAVERGNRRHRKMQKTVYRVRTKENISNRIALDMLRDARIEGHDCTTRLLR